MARTRKKGDSQQQSTKSSGLKRPGLKRSRTRKSATVRIVAAIFSALLVICSAGIYFYPVVKVSSVEVTGLLHADEQEIIKATGILQGDNMLRVDTADAAKKVSSVAWVEKVSVSRSWPTTVSVTVEEHLPLGVILSDVPKVVDEKGKIFLQGVTPEGTVPFLVDESDQAAILAIVHAVTALPEQVRVQLERVEALTAESVKFFFAGDRVVFWGSDNRVSEKAEATRVVLLREGSSWNVSNPAMPTQREK